MYTGLLHTHRLVVILFLVLYLVKTVLLLLNREEALARVTKITRIPEMILSVTFLVTGVVMLFSIAEISPLIWAKIGVVLASIPLSVIGFRRKNKLLATLAVLLIVGAYGMAEANKVGAENTPLAEAIVTDPTAPNYLQIAHGKALYERNCVVCHGEKGNLAKSGAKNLQTSVLTNEEIYTLVSNGKNSMPAYKDVPGYDKAGIEAVSSYVKALRIPQ